MFTQLFISVSSGSCDPVTQNQHWQSLCFEILSPHHITISVRRFHVCHLFAVSSLQLWTQNHSDVDFSSGVGDPEVSVDLMTVVICDRLTAVWIHGSCLNPPGSGGEDNPDWRCPSGAERPRPSSCLLGGRRQSCRSTRPTFPPWRSNWELWWSCCPSRCCLVSPRSASSGERGHAVLTQVRSRVQSGPGLAELDLCLWGLRTETTKV